MSAFVVNKGHIDAMLRAGMAYNRGDHLRWFVPHETVSKRWRQLELGNADTVGQMLIDECVRSVGHCYDSTDLTDLPGPVNAYWVLPYTFRRNLYVGAPTPVETLKLVRCYEYQSCEHGEWEKSEAKSFCDALTGSCINSLPGYEDAPWEWKEYETALTR